jgi:hypothetical protein
MDLIMLVWRLFEYLHQFYKLNVNALQLHVHFYMKILLTFQRVNNSDVIYIS